MGKLLETGSAIQQPRVPLPGGGGMQQVLQQFQNQLIQALPPILRNPLAGPPLLPAAAPIPIVAHQEIPPARRRANRRGRR